MNFRLPYKWVLQPQPEEDKVNQISLKFNFPKVLTKILLTRGYDTEDKIKRFIFPDIIYLDNPFLFVDMIKAVEIVKKHIEQKNKILIWGDRDVDGITSTCLLLKTLKSLSANVCWYIPQNEGYGLHKNVLEKFRDEIKLVITVDCGITAVDEVKYLKENKIDVVITDHHEPTLSSVETIRSLDIPIIDPYLPEYTGMKDLAGVGVALKFAIALMFSYDKNYFNKNFIILDIETTGLSPFTDEICEICAVKTKNFVVQEIFHTLVKPKNKIPPEVIKVHGITDDMVKDAPAIEEVLPKLLEFIKDDTLVIHNVDFDLSFINCYLKKLSLPQIPVSQTIDTLKIAKTYFPLSSYSLSALCNDLFLKAKPTHRALDDALATLELFYYLYFFSNPRLRLFIEDIITLASLGTISDIVPLVKDNRIIVKKGIENIESSNQPSYKVFLKYLKNTLSKNEFSAETISWYLIPLLNSAGRMQQVDTAINFLLSEKISDAEKYFDQLLKLNQKRKNLQNYNLTIFYDLVEQQCNLKEDLILLVVAENIEHGVTGIIANHMLKEFNRPVILLILNNEIAIGTARSPKGVNIYNLLKKCETLFEKFGGHENACGLTIKKENIPLFRQQLKILQKELEILPQTIEIDTELNLEDINFNTYNFLSLLEPCGPENPYPVFLIKNLKVVNWKLVGKKNNHILITFESNNKQKFSEINAICWDNPNICGLLKNFNYFNIIGKLELDEQQKNLIIVLLDLQPVI
jgi:single-stranded-DNA-specific exonuclease